MLDAVKVLGRLISTLTWDENEQLMRLAELRVGKNAVRQALSTCEKRTESKRKTPNRPSDR